MLRTAKRLAKLALVWTVVFLMTFDTVLACQWLRQRSCVCPPVPACQMGPIISQGTIVKSYPSVQSHPSVMGKGAGEGSPSDGYQVPSPTPFNNPATTEPQLPSAAAESPSDPGMRDAPVPDPIDEQPPAAESDVLEPTMPVEPAEEPKARFVPVPAESEPPVADEAPAERAVDPLDDLFNDSADDPPAEDDPAAMEEDAPAADPLDDLFGDPVPDDTGMPTEGGVTEEEPAADPLDNLFGDPDDTGMPAEGESPPANEDATGADALDDLFGDADDESGDLGGMDAPDADATPNDGGFDDLFGDPAPDGDEMPSEDEPEGESEAGAGDLFDDLFGNPPSEDGDENEAEAEADDLFSSSITPKRDLLVRRRWVDNTGYYKIQGKLIAILDGKVRILKENSRTCTVPLGRLSQQDLAYVTKIAMQYGEGVIGQLAAR